MTAFTTSKLTSDRISAAFSSATLSITNSSSSPSEDKQQTTKAYYRDSSGRARVHVHARLEFDTTSDDNGVGVNSLLNCIHPSPIDVKGDAKTIDDRDVSEQDVGADELSTIGEEDGSSSLCGTSDTFFSFECAVASSESHNIMWTVERVTILRSETERIGPKVSALVFELGVHVRGNGIRKEGSIEMLEEGELELRAVLSQREKQKKETVGMTPSSHALMKKTGNSALAAGLLGLELGGGVLSTNTVNNIRAMKSEDPYGIVLDSKNHVTMHYGTRIIQTNPRRIRVTLVPPLNLTVREVCGARAASGSTLVEITVEHSTEWHDENVTVTGIAFHPGQSQLWEEQSDHVGNSIEHRSSQGKSIQGGELSVIDMSRRVRWGFCPGAAPDLPLVLRPYEAFATVIQVDAGEDVRSRAFLSPVSVNASVGTDMLTKEVKSNDDNIDKCGERIMVSTNIRWTTSRVAVENSDAFKVDMSLRGGLNTICRVGAPLIISLRVLNLSMEPRDLMLLMAKDGEGRKNELQWERPIEGRRLASRLRDGELRATAKSGPLLHRQEEVPDENQTFSTAVVSEVNGYTFGVWGLSGDNDGTTRHHRDHELLAVDAALLLGEVKGQHSIEAELRFVPLREGTLDVPNLKLYDKRGGRWYNCCHTLKIVAAAKE